MKPFQLIVVLTTVLAVSPVAAETITGTASVIDGDTLDIHGTRIRLSAMDAIESRQRGEDLGGWMVENGWAVAYRRYGVEYVPAEDQARAAGVGIWKSSFIMPWDWRKGQR